MSNLFFELEDLIFGYEEILFDEVKIEGFVFDYLNNKLKKFNGSEKGFYFEKIVFDFFEYKGIPIRKTKKTRDFGIDGFLKLNLGFIGEVDVGLEIKYRKIGSKDIDAFRNSLEDLDINLGIICCKDSRRLDKYTLDTKLRTLLFSKGIEMKENLINERISTNPVIVLKSEDFIKIVSSDIRAFVRGVYKK
jgi:hypothetical protein